MIVARGGPLVAAGGAADLGHVKTALRIEPDVVRGEKIACFTGPLAAAKSRQKPSTRIENAHAAAGGARGGRPPARPPASQVAQFGHVDPAFLINYQIARPGHIGPFPQPLSAGRK